MSATLIIPRDQWGDARYVALAAQIEAGQARVVRERRSGQDRRQEKSFREHGLRTEQRRRAFALPVTFKVVM